MDEVDEEPVDDGWRVVSRRKMLHRSPLGTLLTSIPEGLAQVNLAYDVMDGIGGV